MLFRSPDRHHAIDSELTVQRTSVATPLVIVNYPPALADQGAQIGQPTTSNGSDGATYVDLPLSIAGNEPVTMARIAIYANSPEQSLQDWFEQNIDTNGVLLQSGSYTLQSLSNGTTALVDTAPFPASYTGPLVNGYAYVISPKGKYIASITLGQDTSSLYQLGYTTPTAIDALLNNITSQLTFNE